MTHEHTAHTGPGLESTPHTDEHLYALTTHFSPLSLALIGPDLAQELVACRDTLQTVIRCSDTYTERYLNQLTAPNGNIARLFKASPSTADLCHKMAEDLNEFTALRDKSPDQNARAVSDSARRLHLGYSHYKFIVPALEPEAVRADIAAEEAYLADTLSFCERLKPLLACYADTSRAEQQGLLEQLTQHVIDHSFRFSEQPAIAAFLVAEAVSGKFERLEKEGYEKGPVLLRFINEGITGGHTASIGEQSQSCFLPPAMVEECRNRLLSLSASNMPETDIAASELIKDYTKLLIGKHRASVQECVQVGLQALRQAEASAAALPPAGYCFHGAYDHDTFPFTMIVAESKTVAQDTQALELLTYANDVSQVKSEIGQFLSRLDSPESAHDMEKTWQDGLDAVGWEGRLRATRKTVSNLIDSYLTAVMESVRPLQRVISGQLHAKKPASTKQLPDKTLKKVHNVLQRESTRTPKSLYDALHRGGVFDNVEKAVITAIACGDWPSLQQTGAEIVKTYNRVVRFAADRHCTAGLETHPIQKVVRFSPDTVYSQIYQKVAKQGRKVLDPLLLSERALLDVVLRDWEAKNQQAP